MLQKQRKEGKILSQDVLIIQGRIQGGGAQTAPPPPPKIGKNMILWRKIVISHTKYPNNFRASLRNWKQYNFLA